MIELGLQQGDRCSALYRLEACAISESGERDVINLKTGGRGLGKGEGRVTRKGAACDPRSGRGLEEAQALTEPLLCHRSRASSPFCFLPAAGSDPRRAQTRRPEPLSGPLARAATVPCRKQSWS